MKWSCSRTRLTSALRHAMRALAVMLALCAMGPGGLTGAAMAAERYVWRNVTVGGGGFIPQIIFSRAEPGLVYARSDMGGAYRYDSKLARWVPLQDQMAQGSYFGIESLAADPKDPNLVYLAAGMYRGDPAAILRSADRGASWEVTPVPFAMGGNEDGRGLGERLAIDPNLTRVLYFGSRHDGLFVSTNQARSWDKVASFPLAGKGRPAQGQPTNGGIAFVLVDPASGKDGSRSQRIIAGSADGADLPLVWSLDGGQSWAAIPGQPRQGLRPSQAALSAQGELYVTYNDGIGPNGIMNGAVWRRDPAGAWHDITPPRNAGDQEGGFMAISLDARRAGRVVVATMNSWSHGDRIWLSDDHGSNWRDLRKPASHEVDRTPFLNWGNDKADFGWWIAGLAIDPFDSTRLAYTTGATIYATGDLGKDQLTFRPWVDGIEQTAVISLRALPEGPALLSGFGDISGFAHQDLETSPSLQFVNPLFSNTNLIDYAGLKPAIVVRSGVQGHRSDGQQPTLAYSEDFGVSWSPLVVPPLRYTTKDGQQAVKRFDLDGNTAIAVSADGAIMVAMTPVPLATQDRGKTWRPIKGLPANARLVADRVEPQTFYAMNFVDGILHVSRDGGQTFTPAPCKGLPSDLAGDEPTWREAPWPLKAVPGRAGEVWYQSRHGLFRSRDFGTNWRRIEGGIGTEQVTFGAPMRKGGPPTVFAIGWEGAVRGIFRSTDEGRSWLRINDDAHEYGRRFRTIEGDLRVPGRVFVATDGRGIVYGTPQ